MALHTWTTTWTTPKSSRRAVDQAGYRIGELPFDVRLEEPERDALANWRSAHGFPLNTIQSRLRQRALLYDPQALVVQRLKRAPTIRRKLTRFPKMRLTQMQDVGGCRAVLDSVEHVHDLEADFLRSRIRHVLHRHDDYIARPDPLTGYRGVHLAYKYRSPSRPEFDNLLIEIQLRTRLQHAWATAVETAGSFLGQHLKEGGGSEEWLTFFKVVSAGFARIEGTAPVPGGPEDNVAFVKSLLPGMVELQAMQKLMSVGITLGSVKRSPNHIYYLLDLHTGDDGRLYISVFEKDRRAEAEKALLQAEEESREDPTRNVVLVAAASMRELQHGYSNYFVDMTNFFDGLTTLMAMIGARPRLV